MNKIGSFIGSIILFIVSCALTALTFTVSGGLTSESDGIGKAISTIILIPLYVVFMCCLVGALGSGIITAIRAVFSEIKGIKITAIILIVLYAALLIIDTITTVKIISNI